jgi:transcriptional regulator
MYIPEAYVENRTEILHAAIDACGLAIFITAPGSTPTATHAPMLLAPTEGPHGTLHFHLARANPQWRAITPGLTALAIFPGPDGYISPSWYASKAEHGRVVPTWNYVTVHAEGTPRVDEEADELHALVTRLTSHHEAHRAKPWAVTDAPKPYTDQMLRAIVGVEMPITRLQGAWKLGQNKTAADRASLLAGFTAEGEPYAALQEATQNTWNIAES